MLLVPGGQGGRCRRRRLVLWLALASLGLACLLEVASAKDGSLAKTSGVKRTSAMHPSSTTTGKKKKKKKASTTTTTGKKKKKKKAPTTTTTGKKKKKDVFDDDDEDEDFEDSRYRHVDVYRPRPKKAAGPSVWRRASEMAKVAAEQAVAASKTASEKAKVLGVEARDRAQKASRFAKAWYSSEYEKFLLTATWPSDQRIPPQLTKRLVESVARFPSRPVSLPEDDPYRVTLRKLWKKMVEKDWRTSLKALCLLHSLSRQAPTPKARALSRTLKSMLADVDSKTGRKYFNRRDLVVKKVDEDKARLVDAYAGFVLRRALLFAGPFDDVKASSLTSSSSSSSSSSSKKKKKKQQQEESLSDDDDQPQCPTPGPTTPAEVKLAARRAQHALLVLEHAAQFVDVARSSYEKPTAAHLVVVACLDLVVSDARLAFAVAHDNVATLVDVVHLHDAANPPSALPLSPALTDDVQKSLEKFKELRPRVLKAAKASVKTLRYFDLKASADFAGNLQRDVLDDETLKDAANKWATRPATAPDDDEDDDDFDDDDDDDDDDDEDDDDDFDDDDDDE